MAAFFQLVRELPEDDPLLAELDNWWQTQAVTGPADMIRGRRMQQQIRELTAAAGTKPARIIGIPARQVWWAAAALVLFAGAGAYTWFQSRPAPAMIAHTRADTEIAPGKDGAILTLEDGSQMILDSLSDGLIATQSGAQVMLRNGQVSYDATDQRHRKPTWNTISTPRGRQFKVELPDGTMVWMNSGSSITYPTFFVGKERRIETSGELYMEVAKDPAMTFKVKVNRQAVIEVTGTRFNVKAYADEELMATTLLSGWLQIYTTTDTSCWHCPETHGQPMGAQAVTLKPGQQAVFMNAALNKTKQSPSVRVLNNIDTDKVMAWKNGFFNFEGASLKEAMNQLVRWYNIEVVYEGPEPAIEFFGEVSRNISLTDLLKALEDVGVHFRLESGRKLVVLSQ